MKPDFSIEQNLGYNVLGIDEAGRGPLAGPVVAAAVILPNSDCIACINDSKKIAKKKREKIYMEILDICAYGIGISTVEEIEAMNILQATLLAMRRATDAIKEQYNAIIIDGNTNPFPKNTQSYCIVKGDAKSLTIAAASIVAKVTRDQIMHKLHIQYPVYNWDKNSGYGTAQHIETIKKYGITPHHRKSFLQRIISC